MVFDKEQGDNHVTAATFGTVLRSLGQNLNETQLKETLAPLGDLVSFEQFLAVFAGMNYQDPINDTDMKDMFAVFSADGQSCSVDDLKKGLQSMGDKITDDEFAILCKEAQLSGTVSFDQFKTIMSS